MPTQFRLLSEFLKRLEREGPAGTPFTWLIGAGMSASSGIPVASDVNRRIILFEYIGDVLKYRPWDPDAKKRYSYDNDIVGFFKWYDKLEKPQFERYIDEAVQWFRSYSGLVDFNPDESASYQHLFKRFFQSNTAPHTFLTALVNRAEGVNLAHLGLAGLLRDHPEWGHTVFTTNFDDMLLKALLILNHSARVFGDLESNDKPLVNPTYPQIVHLHGRHTGYRLLNTKSQTELIDTRMQDSFLNHIRESHLIVLGYSGWDDLVMRALKNWPSQETLLKGDLFWVPFRDEKSLRPETLHFLEHCPIERSYIILNDDRTLDADAFILALCEVLNYEHGGFEPYRKGILSDAKKQHAFVLRQLREHPQFDPRQSLMLIKEALEHCRIGHTQLAIQQKEKAAQLISGEDVPAALRAKVSMKVGIVEMFLGELPKAEEHLTTSLLLWSRSEGLFDSVDSTADLRATLELWPHAAHLYDAVEIETAYVYTLLGQLALRLGHVEESQTRLRKAARIFQALKHAAGVGMTTKLLGDICLREGKTAQAERYLKESLDSFSQQGDIYGQATCLRSLGELRQSQGKLEEAKSDFERSRDLFLVLDDKVGLADVSRGLGRIAIRQAQYEVGSKLLDDARIHYALVKNEIGLGHIESAMGDCYSYQGDYGAALESYQRSRDIYRRAGAAHSIANALIDILKCLRKMNVEEDYSELYDEIKSIAPICKNEFAIKAMIEYQIISETEAHRIRQANKQS